jgi:DNA-directed RNA polymerase specialized sigma24 family protein
MVKRVAQTRRNAVKYVTKESLQREIELSHTNGALTDALHLMFYDMANRIAKKPCFIGYSQIEDLASDAYLKCIENVHKYDISRSNPFAYFTTVIFNSMVESIKSIHKNSDIKQNELERWQEKMYRDFNINVPKTDHVARTS